MEYRRLNEVEFKAGSREYVSYLIHHIDVCDQKNGGKYMNIQIGDKDKVYSGVKLFGASENAINSIKAGGVYRGAIDAKEYNGGVSLVIYNIEEYASVDRNDYLSYEDGYDHDLEELKSYIMLLPDKYKFLVQECIKLTDERFWFWTAAKGMHHSRLGGLVVHTNEVVKNALSILDNCKVPKYCDRELLITGCILHDVGKCFEYKVDNIGNTEYGTQGILEGHISIGLRMIDMAYANIKSNGYELDYSELETLRHCILSHHGKLEYGSPVTPATVEAVILNHADIISAELNRIRLQMNNMEPEQVTSTWSNGGYRNVYMRAELLKEKETL